MYESDEIIMYLFEKYGPGIDGIPFLLKGPLAALTCGIASLWRAGKGAGYSGDPAKRPALPIALWSYEASPFCKVVKERLCELGLAHELHACARGSPKRALLLARTGRFQVPYIEDPNTGVKMFESAEINECAYILMKEGRSRGP